MNIDDAIIFSESNEFNALDYVTVYGVGYIQYHNGIYLNEGFLSLSKRYYNLEELKEDIRKYYIKYLQQKVKDADEAKTILKTLKIEDL